MPTASRTSNGQAGRDEHQPPTTSINADQAVRAACELLLRAAMYARDAQSDRWQFAVECNRLYAAPISPCTLRWMIHKSFALLGEETTTLRDDQRRFRPRAAPFFRETSCLVLTDAGIAFAMKLKTPSAGFTPLSPMESEPSSDEPPNWDPVLRELWVGTKLVKRYAVPAPNQERILSAFMEEKWPSVIDDPLPPVDGMEPKRRLQAAIMCLNRNQKVRVIRFRGNGKGDGIRWEFNSQLSDA